jgi:hypothetical protein
VTPDDMLLLRQFEDMVLNFKKENIKTYVICAGILYGVGETVFKSHFEVLLKIY